MVFENMLVGLKGEPAFEPFWKMDINPLSGRIKRRKLHNPNDAMRELQWRLIRYIRQLPVAMKHSKGFRPGQKPLGHVTAHLKNRFFYLTDVRSAFPTVSIKAIAEVLCEVDQKLAGKEKEVFLFLQKFCSDKEVGGLALGGPVSNELFSLFFAVRADGLLGELCAKLNITYTRYMDDLVFSSRRPVSRTARRQIQAIIRSTGLETSNAKTEIRDLKKEPVMINGIQVRWGGRLSLSQSYMKKLLSIIHLARAGRLPLEKKPGSIVYGNMAPFLMLVKYRKGELLTEQERCLWQEYSEWRALRPSRKEEEWEESEIPL